MSRPLHKKKPSPLKPYKLQEVTWNEILNIPRLAQLLLDTTHLRFPNHTVLFTIELLVDLPESYLTGVLATYGLTNFHDTLDKFIELLWYFYITGAPVKTTPDQTAYLSGIPEDELSKYSLVPGNRARILFMLVTKIKKSSRVSYIPSPLQFSYGRHIIRACLYLGSATIRQMEKERFEVHPTSPYRRNYTLQGKDMLELFAPYVMNYRRDFVIPEVAYSRLHELAVVPEALEELIANYTTTEDNTEVLAKALGMVFPPSVQTSGDRTNYYWQNLHKYRSLLLHRQDNMGPALNINGTPLWDSFTDEELLKLQPVKDWKDRYYLMAQIQDLLEPREEP